LPLTRIVDAGRTLPNSSPTSCIIGPVIENVSSTNKPAV